MAKLILHTNPNLDAIKERRLRENFALTPEERQKKAFKLMRLALLFKNGPIKNQQVKALF